VIASENALPEVIMYTDGACSGNPGPGGWGVYLIYKKVEKKLSGYDLDTTNNRMELSAPIEGLRALKKKCKVIIYTDSKYVQQGITAWIYKWQKNNWLKSDNEPVKNSDLWKMLKQEIDKHDIIWNWVRGHDGNYGNMIADQLAVAARDEARRKK
jgi:ribonuclease HI